MFTFDLQSCVRTNQGILSVRLDVRHFLTLGKCHCTFIASDVGSKKGF